MVKQDAKKPIDASSKFSSSSKVVVSKYNKSSSKTNLHDTTPKLSSNSIFAGGRISPNQIPTEPKYRRETEDAPRYALSICVYTVTLSNIRTLIFMTRKFCIWSLQ